MEINIPQSCPHSVTVRRNPPRRARATPSSATVPPSSTSSRPPPSSLSSIPSFPIDDILSIDLPPNPNPTIQSTNPHPISQNLKVFLRIRPLDINLNSIKPSKNNGPKSKNAWPQNPSTKTAPKVKPKKKSEICLKVNDSHSVTLCAPQSLQDQRRTKSEIYEGFSHVFSDDTSQAEVYERMVNPLVEDFLKGKSGMLAALGPSGSGKTHTVFGSVREPGMVPLALRRIFLQSEGSGRKSSRTFYLSMFEINSERGKGERVLDLSQDSGDVSLQQSTIKGVQEVIISDVQQAESLIAHGMLKRATAMTNSNNQSSRSQCIINIRCGLNKIDVESDAQSNGALLTIVDLAGAEREKRTGNQGARLIESNFINNTSMVFGLCLRSLLEHQKNPKKPLQKHFQNSLLTKYLRDYLEGKKRMSLILTVKSGEEDYYDASFLLRQASPFMHIKFDAVEEATSNSFSNKRQFQTFPKAEQLKRMKFTKSEASTADKGNGGGTQFPKEEITPEIIEEVELENALVQSPSYLNDDSSLKDVVNELSNRDREHHIMINFGKAMWKLLKDYKKKLEVAEDELQVLKESLAGEKERCSNLEDELKGMKSCCSCNKEVYPEASVVEGFESGEVVRCESSSIDEDVRNPVVISSCAAENSEEQSCQGYCERVQMVERQCASIDEDVGNSVISSCAAENSEDQSCQVCCETVVGSQSASIDEDVANSTNSIDISSCAAENSEEQSCQKSDDTPGNADWFKDSKDHKHLDGETNSELKGCVLLEPVVISLQSHVLVEDDSSAPMAGDRLPDEEEVNGQISPVTMKESENTDEEHISNSTKQMDYPLLPASNITNSETCSAEVSETEANLKMCSSDDVLRSDVKIASSCQPVYPAKPKRRLQPASSILLKNLNCLEFDDENEKPKGTRKEKKATADVTKKTQGSIALLRLLTNNRHL